MKLWANVPFKFSVTFCRLDLARNQTSEPYLRSSKKPGQQPSLLLEVAPKTLLREGKIGKRSMESAAVALNQNVVLANVIVEKATAMDG